MSDTLISNSTNAFDEVIAIIDNARENAFRSVNWELINMYWDIGESVSVGRQQGCAKRCKIKRFETVAVHCINTWLLCHRKQEVPASKSLRHLSPEAFLL